MNPIEKKVVKVIGVVGWILVGLGGLFTTWLLIRGFSEGMKEPMLMLFLITLIFCSVAVGMFFVILNIVVKLMIRIAGNTERAIS